MSTYLKEEKLCDLLLTNIGLRMRDFYPDEAWTAVDIPDGDIPINGAVFMKHMESALRPTDSPFRSDTGVRLSFFVLFDIPRNNKKSVYPKYEP
ncbi:uncharacterized protein V1513DRAFT_428434 [Lipomyces chichibuensis]|uniref:uncharacterized protein n=1 Tax=Lipomyces chichibuensis TaxID=1546026 RepID=UPI00334316B0